MVYDPKELYRLQYGSRLPPPPPNQIVYVHNSRRASIESIYEAYWITGKLHLQTKTTRLGSTAYELSAEKIEVYKY